MKHGIIRLGCGLDISKDKFHTCFGVMLSDGTFVIKGTKSFNNTPSGISAFIEWLNKHHKKYSKAEDLPFQIVMETTGVYHELICSHLHNASMPVCLEVASRVKKYLQSVGQYSKTDKEDARGICRMACERKMKRWQPFSSKIIKIRTALRHRKSLIETRNGLTNRLHAMSHSVNGNKEVVASIKRMIKLLDKEIKKAEELVNLLYEADTELSQRLNPIIESIKGLGRITALTIVAETNGFEQIRNAKQLTSYAGYDIIENQSGTSSRPTRISKRGNARIRSELYMCALTMGRYKDGPFTDFFTRIRKRNPRIYKVANVAVQRKLLILIYTLFKSSARYDPNHNATCTNKSSSEQSPELHEIAVA